MSSISESFGSLELSVSGLSFGFLSLETAFFVLFNIIMVICQLKTEELGQVAVKNAEVR